MNEKIAALVQLSREIGREDRALAILGEGNVSVRLDSEQFAVKASGCSLATLMEAEVTLCQTGKVLALLENKALPDAKVEQALLEVRVDAAAKKPSMEALFHAWLLTLEGVAFVAHCHPVAACQVLCSPRARDFAERRMFPDEIVYCGAAAVYVPYVEPGLPLAREIRERTIAFIKEHGDTPRIIMLQNHGIIALGVTPGGVLASVLMANKAAAVFAGAAAIGGPNFLLPPQVERIAVRPDEHYRRGTVEK
jgi:rhamnose utilization protein RhaD (predicted bifunctional aldolase and dehydrogenase)